jgi:hypothetical protein
MLNRMNWTFQLSFGVEMDESITIGLTLHESGTVLPYLM